MADSLDSKNNLTGLIIFVIIFVFTLSNSNIEAKIFSVAELPEDSIYTFAEKMPEFPDGDTNFLSYISKNIKIPSIPESEQHELHKRGVFRFVIQATGKISDIEVVRSIHPILDKEVVRVIESMPDWIPAEHNGKKVNVQYSFPIHFNIQSD